MTRFDCHPRQLRPGVCVCVCVTRSVIGCESVSLSVGIGISSLDVNDTFEEDSPCGWSAGAIPFANWPIRSSSRPIGSSCWCSARGGSPWPSDDNHDRRDQPQQPTATTTTTTTTATTSEPMPVFAQGGVICDFLCVCGGEEFCVGHLFFSMAIVFCSPTKWHGGCPLHFCPTFFLFHPLSTCGRFVRLPPKGMSVGGH